jgi:mannose-1-phosphate guanylyltransferase
MTSSRSNTWALVLAAGDGKRLESLITASGGPAVPKQYCSLRAGPSLLHDALMRARAITTPQRICVVVAEKHQCWWMPDLRLMARDNVVVQPENLGTGVGLLLPLLHILERDPRARIVILPSDHHVRSESTLERSLRAALDSIALGEGRTLLLGVTPEGPDAGLGYIVPGAGEDGVALPVRQFVEKPSTTQALALIEHGALWNTLIIAASIDGLLGLYEHRVPTVVAAMQRAVRHDQGAAVPGRATRALYASLQPLDFSKDILAGQESSLRVVCVPPCGWSDLGTPERVARALAQLSSERVPIGRSRRQPDLWRSALSLAEQHARYSDKAR